MIVKISQVSKKYQIAHQGTSYNGSLKDEITQRFKRLLGRTQNRERKASIEEFWALQDINLTINQGDKLALLGRNGAGKSTLLKIISRITEPTEGRLEVRGKVASVLEVNTGFHPDLTGRENIFLNGAIMGMSYLAMKRKFDEIVAFAEIEKFLDTPVKRYSSGMYARLGFAVAAHLDADLLIIDEVLSVGDIQFQEKCLKKMQEAGANGSTVLFVSHNVSSVLALCNRGIFLEKGRLIAHEPIVQSVNRYLQSCPAGGLSWKGVAGDDHLAFTGASLLDPKATDGIFRTDEKTRLEISLEVLQSHPELVVGFTILNSKLQPIAVSKIGDHEKCKDLLKKTGSHQLAFEIDMGLFHPGEYQIRIDAGLRNIKKILQEDIYLKFVLASTHSDALQVLSTEKDGISLGNRWLAY